MVTVADRVVGMVLEQPLPGSVEKALGVFVAHGEVGE